MCSSDSSSRSRLSLKSLATAAHNFKWVKITDIVRFGTKHSQILMFKNAFVSDIMNISDLIG